MRPIDADKLKEKAVHYSETEYHFDHDAVVVDDIDEAPTITTSTWHRAEEEPRDGQECVIAYLGPTDWIYEHATYHSDLNKALEDDIFIEGMDGFIVDSDVGYARHGLFKYWMPIEPPKEDTDGDK